MDVNTFLLRISSINNETHSYISFKKIYSCRTYAEVWVGRGWPACSLQVVLIVQLNLNLPSVDHLLYTSTSLYRASAQDLWTPISIRNRCVMINIKWGNCFCSGLLSVVHKMFYSAALNCSLALHRWWRGCSFDNLQSHCDSKMLNVQIKKLKSCPVFWLY